MALAGGTPPGVRRSDGALTRLLYRVVDLRYRVVDVRPDEVRALLWSCTYFFCVLAAYYVLRPIRDEMGIAGGVRNLPWLFTGTLVGMLIAHPPFAALVSRLPRVRFVSITYRFFMANILVFYALLRLLPESQTIWVGRAFFIWVSVFNLFVVSVFWAFMVDLFSVEQGKRLFGFIGVGGTLGAVAGSAFTAALVARIQPVYLLLGSVLLLEVAVLSVRRLSALPQMTSRAASPKEDPGEPIGGRVLAGVSHVFRSPYLLGIVAYMLLYTITATFLYFQQAEIVERVFEGRAARTGFFAKIDLLVNVLTLGTQVFLTGRIIKLLGVGVTLALLPLLCLVGFTGLGLVGFAGLGLAPAVGVLVTFQVLRRAGNFSLARPARETLYTVVSREDKYKAKNFIDTFVYRGGDQIGAWSYAAMGWIGLTMTGIAFAAVPLAGVWLLVALWLGRKQMVIARANVPEGITR